MRETGPNGSGRGRLGSALSGLAMAVGCVLFLGGFAWGAVLYQPYTVPTASMAPTIGQGDRVLAQRIDGDQVRRGDVVVFTDSDWGDMPMVKRAVGVGGDKIVCCTKDGRLSVNGKPVEEPYLQGGGKASASLTPFKVAVPEGELFMMGDHRDESLDSRVHMGDGNHGAVPRESVDARVDSVVWPVHGAGMMKPATNFESLPGGISRPGPLPLIGAAIAAGAVLVLGGAAVGSIAQRASRGRARVPARA